jgi:hypothetical protein
MSQHGTATPWDEQFWMSRSDEPPPFCQFRTKVLGCRYCFENQCKWEQRHGTPTAQQSAPAGRHRSSQRPSLLARLRQLRG